MQCSAISHGSFGRDALNTRRRIGGSVSSSVVETPPAGTITSTAASVAEYNITVTFGANDDISSGVAGLEYEQGSGGVTAAADHVSVAGAAVNQSVTIGTLDGIIPGNYWSYKPYLNMTNGDPSTTRGYGTEGVVFVSEYDGLILGQG